MKSSRNLPAMQFKVGSMMTIALAVALFAMIFPTKGVNPFSSKLKIITHYTAVSGLRASSPVWFSGVEVGSVRSVEFIPGSNPVELAVVMVIEKRIQPYIKMDSKAVIKGMGLLGDMYVDLTPGTSQAVMVAEGSELEGVAPKELKEDMDKMMQSAKGLLENLDVITADIRNGKGSLGLLAKDPSLYRELKDTISEMKQFVMGLNKADGTAQKLVQDPALYDELVAAVKDIRAVVADLKQTEQKILSPETKETIDQTVKTASRVVKRVGEYQEKIDKLRFDLNFGLSKYVDPVASGHAHLRIWPNENRYYDVGIQKISQLYGQEIEKTTFDGALAWRILNTPLFIRGGLIRTEYFMAGLDLRLLKDNLNVMLDAYRMELNPVQMDVHLGIVFLDLLELTAGAEDVARRPYYKAGLTIHYKDEDLLTVLMKTLF